MTEIKRICDELGIVLNTKKTQIVKLSRGLTFLKVRFLLTDTGRVIKIANKKGIVRMRRKLKKFRLWLNKGKFTLHDAHTSFMSWQGHIKHCNSYRSLVRMKQLYNQLFGELLANENRINFYL